MSNLGLTGSVAIVTGASRGIGRATALRLAAEGARLVLSFRRDHAAMAEVEEACRTAGADVTSLGADIGQPEAAAALCDLALARHGRVDLLVNNAAVVVDSLLATLTDEEIDAMVQTNVLGVTRMARAVLRPMLRQRSGCIVNLSSAAATRPGRGSAVYAGTKGFVESFTRALAVEVGRKGVRVNAVAPGVIETDMTAPVLALDKDAVVQRMALRRLGRPDEVAAAVAWLASAQSSYLSGAVIPVDGAYVGGL